MKVPVWPSPTEAVAGEKTVWISSDVPIRVTRSTTSTVPEADNGWSSRLSSDFKSALFDRPLVPEKFHPMNQKFEPPISEQRECVVEVVVTVVDRNDIDSDEQYFIELITDDQGIRIDCTIAAPNGGYYAFQTLRQLFYKHSQLEGSMLYTPFAPFSIKDKPLFKHRGLNLDIARNRIDPAAVMRTIDGMASAKLNRLHLHATDSQSWPIEIPALPELAQKGAYSPSQVWTCADLEKVQGHGKRKAVEVFLEIDMPGHTASIYHSHPELIAAYDQRPWEPWAAEPPSGQLKLNCEDVNEFLKTLLADLLPRCAPYSQFFHIGADEINAKVYELDPGIQSSDHETIRPALQDFVNLVTQEIESAGLTPVAWEELLLDWNIALPTSTIIQVWRSHANLTKVLQRGHRAIFGPSSHWYLDGGQGGWLDPNPDNPHSQIKPPFEDWCGPYKNWRQICSYNPFEGVPSELQHLLHGGETSLWCELTDSVSLDSKLWPRVAAAAETLWAGPGKVDEQMTRRLAEFRERLVLQGIGAGMVQMEWALRNPGGSLM